MALRLGVWLRIEVSGSPQPNPTSLFFKGLDFSE